MAIPHAVLFALAAMATLLAITVWRAEKTLAVILGGAAFGITAGLSLSQIGKSFGTGFGEAASGPGLAVLAASLLEAMAQHAGGGAFLTAFATKHPAVVRRATPLAGLIAGLGAVPANAFAILRPLARATGANRMRLALAITAGQGLLLPSPVMIAAATITGADWHKVLAIGLPCAATLLIATSWITQDGDEHPPTASADAPPRTSPAIGLLAATAVLTAMLIVQSLGGIPSEPFGGGSARELLLGFGRPTILLLAGLAIMSAATLHAPLRGIAERAITRAAPMILVLGAAGGLQSLAADSRMADSLAEALSAWHGGILTAFLVAASLKMLIGASPVAAISAAGLMQPALAGLDPTALACTALAIGAGAVSGSHINDPLSWLVCEPKQMARFFAGTLLQGLAASAILAAISTVF